MRDDMADGISAADAVAGLKVCYQEDFSRIVEPKDIASERIRTPTPHCQERAGALNSPFSRQSAVL